jgi:20S proteasome subunit beta 2
VRVHGLLKLSFFQLEIYFSCAGAGTLADIVKTSDWVSSNMELIRMNSNRKFIPVKAAVNFAKQYLFRFQGRFRAHFIYGGVDNDGPHIFAVHPHGSTDRVPYATLGSGSYSAMSVFESRWQPDMSESDATQLVRDAIAAGIFNDLGSGSNVDICVISKFHHKLTRGYEVAVKRGERTLDYTPKRGTTGVLSRTEIPIEIVEVVEEMEIE